MEPLARTGACVLSLLFLWKGCGPLEPSSCTALVLYPWLVLAGLPRRSRVERPALALQGDLALLLPFLALALRVDASVPEEWARGAPARAAIGAILFVVLSLGASIASSGSAAARARAWHGSLWLVVVLCLPLALAVASWGASGGAAPWTALSRASPLQWIHEQCGAGTDAPDLPWGALETSAALLLIAWLARGRESAA